MEWSADFSSPIGTTSRSLGACVALVVLALLLPATAFAGLGDDATSISLDQVHFMGSLQITQSPSFAVHEIHAQTGSVIREYVSPSGKVFAVAWHGPWVPDMQQLLGSYLEQYMKAAQAQATSRPGRHPLQIVQPDFVFQQGGHMRSITGRAYLPQMLPAGVQAEAIQ